MEGFGVIDEVNYGENVDEIEIDESLNDMDAEDCIRKIGNWEKYRKFWLEFYSKKVEEVNNKVDNNIALQKRKLRQFFASVPHRSTKTMEAYDLPSGKLSIGFPKRELVPNKEAILARFVESGDDEFIKVKKELDWSGYKSRLFVDDNGTVLNRDTGEIVTDVAVEMSEPEFKVTINKKTGGAEEHE